MRHVPPKFLSEEPAHSCIHGVILLIEMLYSVVSYSVHSFKVDLTVKVLDFGIVLRLRITLKIP